MHSETCMLKRNKLRQNERKTKKQKKIQILYLRHPGVTFLCRLVKMHSLSQFGRKTCRFQKLLLFHMAPSFKMCTSVYLKRVLFCCAVFCDVSRRFCIVLRRFARGMRRLKICFLLTLWKKNSNKPKEMPCPSKKLSLFETAIF